MSPYGYDYSLAPGAPTGWRSRFATILTVSAVAAISAISGAAVALNLLGPAGSTTADRPVTVATHTLRHTVPARAPVAPTVTLAAPEPATASPNASATAAHSPAPAVAEQPPSPPAAAPSPQPAPVQKPAPSPHPAPAAVAAVEEPPTAQVPEKELTFTQGYARRRAVQAAADAASGVKSESQNAEVAPVDARPQPARAAAKTKSRAAVRAAQEQRRIAEEGGWFGQRDRFDFARHQALAYGERDPRARRPPPQGGFFGGLF
jgi:outer membrane biosynthesis protein TonB